MFGVVICAKRMLHFSVVSLALAPFLLTAWLMPANAQDPVRVYRLGHLALTAESERWTREFALPELARLGFVEGENLKLLMRLARDGCLLGYGANQSGMRRRLAQYVALIFSGAKPSDLPIEQPTTFELAVNLKTARALGVTISPSLLQRADEVID